MNIILNIVTSAYLLSIIVMAFWTNIRPSYINHWNRTNVTNITNINVKPDPEMETLDIAMAVNLVVVAVVGKFSFIHKYSIFHCPSTFNILPYSDHNISSSVGGEKHTAQ